MAINKLKFLAIILFAFVSFGHCSGKEPTITNEAKKTFTNPVWEGADPWMVKHNNEYVYCWSSDNGINVSRSTKLTRKGEVKKIVPGEAPVGQILHPGILPDAVTWPAAIRPSPADRRETPATYDRARP